MTMDSRQEAEKAPYTVEIENGYYVLRDITRSEGFRILVMTPDDIRWVADHLNTAFKAGGGQTVDPAPTVEALATEVERWYLGLSDKPHQDGVLMLDRKANGYVLSDEERTRLRSRLTALYASPPTVEVKAVLERLQFLFSCDDEAMASGQPTKADWREASEMVDKALALYASPKGWTDQEIERIAKDYVATLAWQPAQGRAEDEARAFNVLEYARDHGMKAGNSPKEDQYTPSPDTQKP